MKQYPFKAYQLYSHGQVLDLSKPAIMGILNVTPDSFSDGGRYVDLNQALAHAKAMVTAGAKIIDIGGESTRPGAAAVTEQQEMDRVLPVVDAVRDMFPETWISVDTSTPKLMAEAYRLGAHLINDVRALSVPGAIETVVELQAPVCLMHMQGQPQNMQDNPSYDSVVWEVISYLQERVDAFLAAGGKRKNIVLDPGFGFGKALDHNFTLLAKVQDLIQLDYPVLIGLSRKSMFGQLTGVPVDNRLPSSLMGAMWCALQGSHILRVHDVAETAQALQVLEAIRAKCTQPESEAAQSIAEEFSL